MQILRQASGVTSEHAHLGLMQGPLQAEVRVGEKKTNCSFLFSVPRVLRGPTEPGPPCACSWTATRGSVPPPTHPAIWTREHVKKTEPTPRLHPPPNQLQQPLHLKLLQLQQKEQTRTTTLATTLPDCNAVCAGPNTHDGGWYSDGSGMLVLKTYLPLNRSRSQAAAPPPTAPATRATAAKRTADRAGAFVTLVDTAIRLICVTLTHAVTNLATSTLLL